MSHSRFENRVAFVTGGASGIGAAAARRFSAEGARVAIADIDAAGAHRLAAELPDAMALDLDVTDARAVEAAFAATLTQLGGLDVVFNNAGLNELHEEVHETGLDNWHRITRINGDGFFFVLKHGIAALLQTGGGSIVNTASIAGLKATRNMSPYTFTKAGIVGLTRAAALEYADRGIRVNAVAPGTTLTPLMQAYADAGPHPAETMARLETMNPIQGAILPDDIADAVLFLASDEARKITGHTIPVDGGYIL